MTSLVKLEVENFKSWRGKHIIGPFMQFNCIMGTNGSGKSNVMDALGFVMGEPIKSLRVKHTRDLIHGANIERPVSNTARVTMVISSQDGELHFCRTVLGDNSVFHVNDSPMTLARYLGELQKIGIFTKTRNCLVFQGAVESIAMMNPKERTKIFERISLSSELVDEYETLRKAMLEAKDQTQSHLTKKRQAIHLKKTLDSEKKEAKVYQTMLDDLNQSTLQLMLFQLHCNKRDVDTLNATKTERQEVVEEKEILLSESEQRVKTSKREHGRYNRELQQVDKDIRSEEQTLSACQSQYTKTKVNASHHLKKAEEARSALQDSHRQRNKMKEELKQGKKEVAELQVAWRSYEEQFQRERAQDRDVELGEEQLERYKQLKEVSRRQGAVTSQKVDKLQWDLKSDQEKISFDQRRKKELEVTIKSSQGQLEDLTKRAEKLEEYTKTCRAQLEEYRQQEVSLSEELQRGRQRSEEVNVELGEVLVELREAGDESHESLRQQHHKEVLESLRRQYPDAVFGRLVELCHPIHRRYQLAVTKVFGRYMNAIVVTTEKTARDCIEYIKTERAEPETFLPIDFLDVTPINERLREIEGAKLVFDVVQCVSGAMAAQLKRAVQFVCGNALVCETIKDAQSVAFSGPERIKTVALDGTMFSKSGVISGGSSDLRTKAKRWDEKDMKQLKERKDHLTAELRGLMKLRRKEQALKQVQVQAQGSQTRLRYSDLELENLRKTKIPECQAERSRLESLLANLEAEIQMQQENVERKEAVLKSTRDSINQMEDTVFADFCAEIGVENIRQYEHEYLKEQAELDQKRLVFDGQTSRLNAQLEYMQQQVEKNKRKQLTLEETIAKEDSTMEEQKEGEEKLLKAVEESQNKLQALQDRLQTKKKEVSDAKTELDEDTKNFKAINRELVTLQKSQISTEVALEQKFLARHNLLLDCKIQGVDLTLISGSFDDIADVQLDEESGSALGSAEIYLREAQLDIDFSDLPADLTIIEEEEQIEAQLENLRHSKASIEMVLAQTSTPNLKALGKLKGVKASFREARDALDGSTVEARNRTKEFNDVKSRRCELFNKCFEHVRNVIDPTYKRLCKNNSAQAFLSADNEDEPYLAGINYNCVAPGKRSMEMENLSGGEKTIASLALVFALHDFRPAPFFVLDEVDAALDNTNIRKVTDFIREESRENMQIIVISLKEEFYSRSDALLGVCSDIDDCIMSRMLSLDLRPFPLDDEDHGRELDQEAMDELGPEISMPPEAHSSTASTSGHGREQDQEAIDELETELEVTMTPEAHSNITMTSEAHSLTASTSGHGREQDQTLAIDELETESEVTMTPEAHSPTASTSGHGREQDQEAMDEPEVSMTPEAHSSPGSTLTISQLE